MTAWRIVVPGAVLLAVTAAGCAHQAESRAPGSLYAQWKNGPSQDPSYFPIAVWCQDPELAPQYQKAGINLYFALWQGPTEEQLAVLKKYGMQVICAQNAVGLAHVNDPLIVGWMHDDEPDNAQRATGAPIPPAKVIEDYEACRKADPTRPVFINLGRGAAWDDWHGRGTRNHHPEDFPEYLKGCDIASFDIYPVANMPVELRGQLSLVANGVSRLIKWGKGKPVWNALECTRIHGEGKPTTKQVRAEVWLSLVHGSRGITWFVHQFLPEPADVHALLDDPEMLAAVTAIDNQIHQLAPVLNSPTVEGALKVESSNEKVPMAAMMKRQGGATYVFAVPMKIGGTLATFTLDDLKDGGKVEVIGENRQIEVVGGKFDDTFDDWDVHLYRIHPYLVM